MAREAAIVVHSLILTALLLFNLVGGLLFWKNRHLYPISARKPFRATFGMLLAVSSVAICSTLSVITNYNIHCLIWAVLSFNFGYYLGLLTVGSKLLSLCILHAAEVQKRKLTQEVFLDSKDNLSDSFQMNVLLRVQQLFSRGRGFKVGLVLFGLMNISTFIGIAIVPGVVQNTSDYNSPACVSFGYIMAGFTILVALAFIIVTGFLVRSLYYVEDNYLLKKELKVLSYSVLVMIVFYLLLIIFPSMNEFSNRTIGFKEMFLGELPSFWMLYTSIFLVWRKSVEHEQRQNSTQKDDSNVSQQQSSRHLSTLGSQRLSRKDEIEIVIQNSDMLSAFVKFLTKDFCSEGIYFLLAVKEFKSSYEKRSESERKDEIKKIYQKFVEIDSPLCVNVSGDCRAIVSNIVNGLESHAADVECFDKAYVQIAELLGHDSLPRFKRTPEFRKIQVEDESKDAQKAVELVVTKV